MHEHLLRTAAAGRWFDPEAGHHGEADGFESRELAAAWLEREESNWITALRRVRRDGLHVQQADERTLP